MQRKTSRPGVASGSANQIADRANQDPIFDIVWLQIANEEILKFCSQRPYRVSNYLHATGKLECFIVLAKKN